MPGPKSDHYPLHWSEIGLPPLALVRFRTTFRRGVVENNTTTRCVYSILCHHPLGLVWKRTTICLRVVRYRTTPDHPQSEIGPSRCNGSLLFGNPTALEMT